MPLENIIQEFEKEFCNNHQKPIRFLRSIFFDEQDGAEQIEKFIIKAYEQSKQETLAEVMRVMDNDKKELGYGATLNNEICEYGCLNRVKEIIKSI